jgi:hypothetical protein
VNIYEVFGLVLVLGMVTMLLTAARALGENERAMAEPAETAPPREKSPV